MPVDFPARTRRPRRSISAAQAFSTSSSRSKGWLSRLASSWAATSARSLRGSSRASFNRASRFQQGIPCHGSQRTTPPGPFEPFLGVLHAPPGADRLLGPRGFLHRRVFVPLGVGGPASRPRGGAFRPCGLGRRSLPSSPSWWSSPFFAFYGGGSVWRGRPSSRGEGGRAGLRLAGSTPWAACASFDCVAQAPQV